MKGIIIAGGLGTRLRPLTYHRPKPLVPVANRPFLEYQVALLRQHGIEDIVFATNYMAEQIEAHFGDGTKFGVRMRYAIEETPLGTGGAIRNASEVFPGEAVAVFNGDVLTDFDLSAILAFHRERSAISTITLSPVPSPNPFGVLTLEADGRVHDWREPSEDFKKALARDPNPTITGTDLINAGFYVLEPECLARIPHGTPSSVERDIYPRLLAERAGVFGIAPGGFWMDVGRPEQLMVATRAVVTGAVTTLLPLARVGEGSAIAASAHIGPTTVVGRNCRIEPDARLDDCILMDGVTVGAGAHLRGVIVDTGATIEASVTVGTLSETGAGASGPTPVVAAHSLLKQGTRV